MEYGLVVLWLVTYLAVLAVGMPIAAAIFPRFDDRGLGVALPLALAIVWFVTYFLGRLSITFGLVVGLLVLLGTATLLVASGRLPDLEIERYAETALVFTVAFLFAVAIRAVDPAAHFIAGEKFLDMGLLQTSLRAQTLPPEDMWFAGETVRYYYGGHLLASLLARITVTPGRFAYNLALAGYYGMLVTAVYGLAGAIAAHRGYSRRIAGGLGAFLAGFASNAYTPVAFVVGLLPDGVIGVLGTVITIPDESLVNGLSKFSYWSSTRIIDNTINEFPLFAWLNGDLHAHMMSMPFTLLVAALLFSYWRSSDASRWRQLGILCGIVPAVGAMIAVVNTWSFPSVAGLTFVAVALAPHSPVELLPDRYAERFRGTDPWIQEAAQIIGAALLAGVVFAIAYAWSLPYWLVTASQQSGIGLFPERSSLGGLLLVHGAFLLVFALYLYRHAAPFVTNRSTAVGLLVVAVAFPLALGAPVISLVAPILVIGWVVYRYTLAAHWQRLQSDSTSEAGAKPTAAANGGGLDARLGYEMALLIAGAGLVLLVDFAFVQEQAGPTRLNTVFKTYTQVWILWSVAAGVVLTRLAEPRSPQLAIASDRWTRGFRVFAAVLVVSLSLYGVLALTDHFGHDGGYKQVDDPTMDALAFVHQTPARANLDHSDEAAAIEWFATEVDGQPTIVEDPGDSEPYQWVNPAASLTGVPSVAGWWPEGAYRGQAVYDQRVADIETIYTGSADRQRALLATYNVTYVYLGPNEREEYDTARTSITIDERAFLTPVPASTDWANVTVYRVDETVRTGR